MTQCFFITTALDYPIGTAHLGGAWEKIAADVQARYQRMRGEPTRLLLGSDEHPSRLTGAARAAGVSNPRFVDERAVAARLTWNELQIEWDVYVRTSGAAHAERCASVLRQLHQRGWLYEREHETPYCVMCEEWRTPDDLVGGRCRSHPERELSIERGAAHFFALSRLQGALLAHYREHPDWLRPRADAAEVCVELAAGLADVCITRREVAWGIKLPFAVEQTVWIWFEALLGYLTGAQDLDATLDRAWPPQLQVVGRDIRWYHGVLWPAMLLALGLPLPKTIQLHGIIRVGGVKMSKTIGNGVDVATLIRQVGNDGLRYWLLRYHDFEQDMEFRIEDLLGCYRADLWGVLGRLHALVVKDQHLFASPTQLTPVVQRGSALEPAALARTVKVVEDRVAALRYDEALELIWERVLRPAAAEVFALTDPAARFALATETLRVAATLSKPFMPATSAQLYRWSGATNPYAAVQFADCWRPAPSAWAGCDTLAAQGPLVFPELGGSTP